MNKTDDSNRAIEELELTNEIKILPDEADENLAKSLIRTRTRAELIRNLQINQYSEFMIGVIIGYTLQQESKIEIKRDRFRKFIPSFMKKD